MSKSKKITALLAFLSVVSVSLAGFGGQASAINVRSATGGDGYTPLVRTMNNGESRVFVIYHHLKTSATGTPEDNINCVIASTSSICPGYPKYFSSVAGTSNSGVDDISTSFYPHYTTEGSKVYYAAQRVSDNGVGCFDMEAGTNCGYTALGSLAISTNNTRPASVEGVERVGDKIYSVGKDANVYCYSLTTLAACAGQPYDAAPGDAAMPDFDSDDLRVPMQTIGTNIYFAMNYFRQSTPANARLNCFDTLTNTRCSGWSASVALAGTNTSNGGTTEGISSVFASYNSSAIANAVCTIDYGPNGPTCWNLANGVTASVPAGLMVNLPASLPREETRVGNKTYFAFYQKPGGFAECYDFGIQARCAGFTSPHFWAGISGGDTRDYGYTYVSAGCFVATGDTGVLWSFDEATGATTNNACLGTPAAATTAVIPAKLPDTGMQPSDSRWSYVVALAATITIVTLIAGYRKLQTATTKG